jgi:hypothetical protein
MRRLAWIAALVLALGLSSLSLSSPQPLQSGEEVQIADNPVGSYGRTLVVAESAEPKTLNPVSS